MTTVTIAKRTYDRLKREALAWRHSYQTMNNDDVIFNADRDNGGKSIPADKFVRVLEKLIREDQKAS
jgi:hypothetical protein